MYGLSAVATAVLRSSSSRQRAASAWMPSTQRVRSDTIDWRRMVEAVDRVPGDHRHHHVQLQLAGFRRAVQIVTSQPITW